MPHTTSHEPTRILLVEDSAADRRLLEEVLRGAPRFRFELLHASRLAEAEQLLAEQAVDVVLLDLSLPDAHGMVTIERTLRAAPQVPVVVLTGLDDEQVALEAVQRGAQDYLIKGSLESGLFVRSIRYARERKRLERERAALLESERAARAAAESAVQARDEVLRVVSHDIGNSLSAIGIHARLLGSSLPEGEAGQDARERAVAIRELVTQMHRLRQDLLDVASIEAGRLSLEPSAVDAAELVDAAVAQHREIAADKGVCLRAAALGRTAAVTADRERVLQALGNLIGNAVKLTPEGGSVTVAAEPREDGVRLTVSDTGPGLAADELPHVFDRFWQARQTFRSGAGLGLAIVKGIAEAHGGRVEAHSVPGEGATFTLVLPAG